MRVDNLGVNSASGSLLTEGIGSTGKRSIGSSFASSGATDQIALSGVSDFLSLAKGMVPVDKANKFTQVQGQVSAGQYTTDSSAVSKSMVEDHLAS